MYLKYTKYMNDNEYKDIRYLKNIILFKNSRKISTPFGTRVLKKMAPFLAFWHVRLKNWHAFARWRAKLKNWRAFG